MSFVQRQAAHCDQTITEALKQATDAQIASENARRNQAKRKVKSGGRNGGRPKKACECGQRECCGAGALHNALLPAGTR